MAKLLRSGKFSEFFLQTEDNLFNKDKVEFLREGVSGRVRNLILINSVGSFDVLGHNYSNACHYLRRLLNEVEFAECRWDK